MKSRILSAAGAALLAAAVSAPSLAAPEDVIRAVFAQQFPSARIDHLSATPIPGIYQVGLGSTVLYASADGRYVFQGKLVDLSTRADLSESYLSRVRLERLADYDEARMIVFEPKGEAKHTVTVFTDIDCPYCRKLHDEMGEYADLGVRVRYMLYPRAGLQSPSGRKAVSVWCSSDRQEQLTFAKAGGSPEPRTCDNPVEEHLALGRELGLRGTPMTITDSGEQIMGYVPARQLFAQMEIASARSGEADAAQ